MVDDRVRSKKRQAAVPKHSRHGARQQTPVLARQVALRAVGAARGGGGVAADGGRGDAAIADGALFIMKQKRGGSGEEEASPSLSGEPPRVGGATLPLRTAPFSY